MSVNPFQEIKKLFTKEGHMDKSTPLFLINKILSFNNSTVGIAQKMDKYIFWGDKDIIRMCYEVAIPKQRVPFFRWIGKGKGAKTDRDFIYNAFQEYFGWTDNDLWTMRPLLDKLLDDKETLKEVLFFIGADLKYFKKFKIDLKTEETGGLGQWMK